MTVRNHGFLRGKKGAKMSETYVKRCKNNYFKAENVAIL